MITQAGRESQISNSIKCFAYQTFSNKELIIVHDGDEVLHHYILTQANDHKAALIKVFHQSAGKTLGELRNIGAQHANFATICQWDDDDLYHPDRLKLQYACLINEQADFCFMTDQLHLFSESKFLFWDDWLVDEYPNSLIPGSIMGSKEKLGEYPDLERGEDSALVFRLCDEGYKITPLSGHAWLYVYIYHGSNTWEVSHHKAISSYKRLTYPALKQKIKIIKQQLPKISIPFEKVYMPHEKGKYEINLKSAAQLS